MTVPASRADERSARRAAPAPATQVTTRVVGVLAALAAVEHGVGELTQPHPDDGALVIESWPHVAAFDVLDGEPALTLLPDVRAAGLVTVLVALCFGWWVARTRAAPRDGWSLLGFAATLLLVGGGFGPPLLATVLGLALLHPATPGRARPLGPARRALARRWPALLALTVAAFVALFPGLVLLSGAAGADAVWLPVVLPPLAFSALLLTVVAARDRDRHEPTHRTER